MLSAGLYRSLVVEELTGGRLFILPVPLIISDGLLVQPTWFTCQQSPVRLLKLLSKFSENCAFDLSDTIESEQILQSVKIFFIFLGLNYNLFSSRMTSLHKNRTCNRKTFWRWWYGYYFGDRSFSEGRVDFLW